MEYHGNELQASMEGNLLVPLLRISTLNTTDSLYESAYLAHQQGAQETALQGYREVLARHPEHIQARHHLGILLHQMGQSEQGIELILEALQADSSQAARFNDLGNILCALNQYDNAVQIFELAVQLDPSLPMVWNNLGVALWQSQHNERAESAFLTALERDPDNFPATQHLATLLGAQARDEEASYYACKAYLHPPFLDKSPRLLGIACYRLGLIEQAAHWYREWLAQEPDNAIARHYVAACSQNDVPPRAPDLFVVRLFDEMANEFDHKLVTCLDYRGPELATSLISGLLAEQASHQILDGGCGTGLCASALAPYARHLVGVDLSPRMLDKAREHPDYHELEQAELTHYLTHCRLRFDLILLMEILIYTGDLMPILQAAAGALNPSGLLAFTVEIWEPAEPAVLDQERSQDYTLAPSGRYCHTATYLEQCLSRAGFEVIRRLPVILRKEFCQEVSGLGITARRLEPASLTQIDTTA